MKQPAPHIALVRAAVLFRSFCRLFVCKLKSRVPLAASTSSAGLRVFGCETPASLFWVIDKAIERSGYLGADNVYFDRAFSAIEGAIKGSVTNGGTNNFDYQLSPTPLIPTWPGKIYIVDFPLTRPLTRAILETAHQVDQIFLANLFDVRHKCMNTKKPASPSPRPDDDPNLKPYTNPHVQPGKDPNTDPYSDPHPDPDPDPETDPNLEPYVNPDPEPEVDPNLDPYTNPEA